MASDDWHIEMRDSASDADTAELRAALHEYNFAMTGYRDGRDLACVVRDNGRLVAGLAGFTWGGYARVDLLWVDEAMRRRGLGRALLTAADDEARRRDCTTIVLDTHSFQAPGSTPVSDTQRSARRSTLPSASRQRRSRSACSESRNASTWRL